MSLPDFLLQAWSLKDEARSGWALRGIREPESVADHSWGTALLCFLYAPQEGVDRERAVAMALVHDLAEAETGDMARGTVAPAEKARREREAMDRLAGLAAGAEERQRAAGLRRLWEEYEGRVTREAVFVRDMNLIDMCLQALRYELQGRRGGAQKLDEFFDTSEPRLGTATGRELFARVRDAYRGARRE